MFPDDAINSARLHTEAQQVLVDGNTRHTLFSKPFPPYAASASGCRVTDVDGVERIDFINNYSSLIHGHNHPTIHAAVTDQLSRVSSVGLPTEHEVNLANTLSERLPSLEKIRFVNSGTEAVMMAVKAARAFTGKRKVAKIEGAFHGSADFAEISLAPTPDNWGSREHPNSVPVCPGTPAGICDDVVVIPLNDIEAGRAIINATAADLACVLIDPCVSRMGYISMDRDYLVMLRELTAELGVVLCFDEVYSLRLGYRGFQGEADVIPDLTAMGKIIGGGFPVGAIGGSNDIMSVFSIADGFPKLPHGGTFNANPITMVAGLHAMQLLDRDALTHLENLGHQLRSGLELLLSALQIPGQVYGMASLASLRFNSAKARNYREYVLDGHNTTVAKAVFDKLLNQGILTNPSLNFILSTPMQASDIDYLLEQLETTLAVLKPELLRG